MRIVLVTGPGGSGTSTVAAATAQRLAADGLRVRLLGARPLSAPGVDVVAVAPQPAFESLWGRHLAALSAAAPVLSLPPATSVVALPGSAELAVLGALADAGTAVDGAGRDVVVLDAGPIGQALGLIALPGALRWWLDQVAPAHVRVMGAVRGAAARAGAVRSRPVDQLLAAVAAVDGVLASLALGDPVRTAVHLVVRPEPGSAAAVAAASTEVGLLGQRLASVTVNRVLPAGAGEWWAARSAEQDAAVAELERVAGAVRQVRESARAPVDGPGMRALGVALPDALPVPVAAVSPDVGPVRVDGGWRLDLPLPHALRGAVELTRWNDDLVVSVRGRRRSFPLDPLLRRCVVSGGRLADPGTRDATLEVLFHPDVELWPTGLLETEGSPA